MIPANKPVIPANKPVVPAPNPELVKNNKKEIRKIRLITEIIDKAYNILPNPLYFISEMPNFKALFAFFKT